MPERTASEVADLLEEIGRRAAFESDNPYKAKAYVRAAASVRRLVRPLDDLIREGALQTIPGVGAAIAKRIEALHRGGTDEPLERMRQKLPAGLLPLLGIPSLRPATILRLHDLLGVSSLDDLAAACRQGKVAPTKGLGRALERKILQGLTIASESAGRLRMNQAQAVLDQTIAELGLLRPALRKVTIAGDLRRSCELISDLRLTDFSDGVNTLEEMAEAARERGYAYLGVADHSQSAHYAGGLSLEEIEAQHALANALNRRYRGRFRILKGIESDILSDGALDYPSEVLARFDFVVASVHSRFRLDRAEQTRRILAAVANPYTTILGHLTGRQLLRRPGYDVDVEVILKACAQQGVAVEINSNPWRLELDWRWHRKALELGCMLSINPDAHSIAELDLVQWGVAVARKGGVPKEKVFNALNLIQMVAHLERRRSRQKTRLTRERTAQQA